VSWYQKGRTNLDFTEAGDSDCSWAVCSSAPRSRQITTPAPLHSILTGQMPFLPPNQQRQSTEGTALNSIDSFCLFCSDNLTWSSVKIEPAVLGRTGHTAVCCPRQFKSRDVDTVLVFGGGDNEGKFFNDLFSISISTSRLASSAPADALKPSNSA